MKKLILTIVLAMLCLFFKAEAQMPVSEIKPLNIGDTIPEAIWRMPLQVVNHPTGKKTITLNDFRGKLIILDFWATWCSACISEMPRTNSIETEYNDEIAIIGCAYEDELKVSKYIPTNEILRKVNPLSIVGDKTLSRYFPHKLIPHYVWLYKDKIIAFTKPEEITSLKIKSVIDNQSLQIKQKKDILNFNVDIPLLQNSNIPINNLLKYNSVLTKYINGLFSGQGVKIDSVHKRKRYYFINRPILSLYSNAVDYELNNKVILNVENLTRFTRDKTVQDEWQTLNSYCYELTVPIEVSEAEAKIFMLDDLNRYLGLKTIVKDTLINCLVLSEVNAKINNETRTKIDFTSPISQVLNSQVQGRPIKPIIVDESKRTSIAELNTYKGNPLQLQKHIKQYGLKLTPVKRMIKMFILTDQGPLKD